MGLPKYIVNFDELTEDLKKQILNLINKELNESVQNKFNGHNLEDILKTIKDKISKNKYEDIIYKINDLVIEGIKGKQKIEGRILNIPAIKGNYKEEFKFKNNIYITGLHFNQTGWKKEDIWNLEVNKNKIIESYTKEIGEHKYFNTYYKVNANTPISFILRNNSGNSRQTMMDLEYIGEQQVEHDIEDISNKWDLAVRMNWEENTNTDIDLYGVIDDKIVYFGNKSMDNFYLNWDYINHIDNNSPEIISIKGYTGLLKIYVNNFSNTELTKPIEVKIYKNNNDNITLLKTYNVKINNDRTIANGICEIDLSDFKITDMSKEINVNNLRK